MVKKESCQFHHPHALILELCGAQVSQRGASAARVTVGMAPKSKLPSKIHSCSELEESKKLLEVKREGEKEEDLQKKIKDMV